MRSYVQQRRRCARVRVEGRKDLPSNFYERRSRNRGGRRHTSCSLVISFDERNRKETTFMNQDILTGKWKQMRGQVKQWWGKLTDDDLDRVDGAMDKLAGALQERYGWERDQAEREMKTRFDRYDEEMRDPARR